MRQRAIPSVSPTANLAGLLFVLAAMWYAASSQNSAAVYLLFFALTSVFLVSIPHTLLNLGGLKATAQSVKPTFAGQEVSLPVEILNESRATRRGIALSLPNCDSAREQIGAIAAGKAARVMLRFSAPTRGSYEIGTLCLTSVYPLGFLRSSYAPGQRSAILFIPSLPVIRTFHQAVRVRGRTGRNQISEEATILAACAPTCPVNRNVTSTGKPWRAGSL